MQFLIAVFLKKRIVQDSIQDVLDEKKDSGPGSFGAVLCRKCLAF